jgi:hypothetical protein
MQGCRLTDTTRRRPASRCTPLHRRSRRRSPKLPGQRRPHPTSTAIPNSPVAASLDSPAASPRDKAVCNFNSLVGAAEGPHVFMCFGRQGVPISAVGLGSSFFYGGAARSPCTGANPIALGLNKSTVYRLLQALSAANLVRENSLPDRAQQALAGNFPPQPLIANRRTKTVGSVIVSSVRERERRQGWTLNDEESEIGIRTVGAPSATTAVLLSRP